MEQNQTKKYVLGIILIALGLLFFLNNFNIRIRDWFLLALGLGLIFAYFTKKQIGFLIAGLILSYTGSLIFIDRVKIINKEMFGLIFLMILGLAFLIVYFIKKKIGFIFPGLLLLTVGAYGFIMELNADVQMKIWPLIFMMLALAFLFIFIFEFKHLGYKPLIPAALMLVAGILAFLTTRGIISMTMWQNIMRVTKKFWPVLLMIAGALIIYRNLKEKY